MTQYTREDIIQDIKDLAEKLGHVPTKSEFLEFGKTHYAFVFCFGSFNTLLTEAGFSIRRRTPRKYNSDELNDNTHMRETIIEELKKTYEKYPDLPASIISRKCPIPYKIIKAFFPTAQDIAQAIDYRGNTYIYSVSAEDVKSDLIRIAIENPGVTKLSELLSLGKYSLSTYTNKLGNYKKLREIVDSSRQFLRRYPVRYYASSATLKWNKKRR